MPPNATADSVAERYPIPLADADSPTDADTRQTPTPAPTPTPIPTPTPLSGNVARYYGCPVFTAGDYYNAPVTNAAIDPNSANYINAHHLGG